MVIIYSILFNIMSEIDDGLQVIYIYYTLHMVIIYIYILICYNIYVYYFVIIYIYILLLFCY